LKGQGQITEYEQKLLERAEAGNIEDFTIPELKDFVSTTEKLARRTHAEHKRLIGVMRQKPETADLVPYYDVPDLPAEPKPATGNRAPEKNAAPRAGETYRYKSRPDPANFDEGDILNAPDGTYTLRIRNGRKEWVK
jgi:hypothetical protein